jgi:C4-dicarboxylate transporter DctQ subunit
MKTIDTWIERSEDFVVGAALALAVVATFLEVVARYGFNASIGTGGELAIFSIIWAAMIGAAVAARTGVHIGVDVLVKKLPVPVAKFMVLFSLVASAAFTGLMTVLGVDLVRASFATGQLTNELLIPRWPLYLSVPTGMGLMTYHLVQQIVRQVRMPAEQVVAAMGTGHHSPPPQGGGH